MSKEDKLDILSIIEASPIKKQQAIALFGISPVRYYRWQLKYYLDNCLDDRRGRYERKGTRLADLYRKQIKAIRKQGVFGKYVIGPETIMGKLEDEGIFLSHETIRQVLHQEGLIEPRAKAPRHEYKRFEAEEPNVMWQIDILYAFVMGFGYVYIFSVLDDHSRRIMHWRASPIATGKEAVDTIKEAMEINNVKPEKILTDRGTQFYSGVGKRYGQFEKFLASAEIKHILARVKHPQTLGKIERYHRTMRQMCLNLQSFSDPIELRRALRVFVDEYNYRRKHKGIGRVTPHQRYTGLAKEIIERRDKLRQQIIKQRRTGYVSEEQIQKEVVASEIVSLLKKAYTREVILV
ncbi:MAG: DDE-type integrase/transposase/recombinase [Candidatus Margulisbacteria bacterium]|nr:DDE-type integrase/transposase/recombinase [Candidatus Margulisiibacteriota bacterium]